MERRIFCKDYDSQTLQTESSAEDWNLREEMLLIEGMQHCGFGNWGDVAAKVETKNKEQCEQHYLKVMVVNEVLVEE